MVNEEKLEQIMLELGHRDNILGTGYLRAAVALYDRGMSITKELYPALAAAFASTPIRVERAMRHSITTAWDRGDQEVQLRYFGYTISPARGVPTVSEYIARMSRVCHED